MRNARINPVDLAASALCLTDKQFAEALKISPAAVSRWRRQRRIPADRLPQVCKLTGLPLAALSEEFSFTLPAAIKRLDQED